MSKVTISDVARAAGVAVGTVSNAFNHPEKVRSETLASILSVAEELGYAPNESARMLAGGQNDTFGLMLPSLAHGISLQMANGANDAAKESGYRLLIASASDDEIQQDNYMRYFVGTQMAGVLVQPMFVYGWRPQQPARLPTVYLDFHSQEAGYYVGADNVEQGRIIAEHAVECGAHRIVVIGNDEFEKLGMRKRGIYIYMWSHPEVSIEIINEGSWNDVNDGYEIGLRLAERPAEMRPDFIIALTDILGTGAIAGILDAGLSVPDDIAVAGCDGNPLAWTGTVPLTTIATGGYEMGRLGVQYLLEQVEAERQGKTAQSAENHQQLVKPKLMVRASTGGYQRETTTFESLPLDIGSKL